MRNRPSSVPTWVGHFAVNTVISLNVAVSKKRWFVLFTVDGFHCGILGPGMLTLLPLEN